VGNSAPLLISGAENPLLAACLLANLNSLVFDYLVRQKIAGMNLNFFLLEQLPVLVPDAYSAADTDFVVPRVLELVYTAWDMKPFADYVGCKSAPFHWSEGRRSVIRAELDAYYAMRYGLRCDELRYVLDPSDVHGEGFPGETFRVLIENETRKYGEYRTRRLVLEAYDRLVPEFERRGRAEAGR
jgi:hypothetical protein